LPFSAHPVGDAGYVLAHSTQKPRFTRHKAENYELRTENLLVPVHNPAAIQIVGTQFHGYAISGENPDKILAHPTRDMGQHLVVRLELHLEHGIGQRFNNGCHYLNRVFLRQTVHPFAGSVPAVEPIQLSALSHQPHRDSIQFADSTQNS
jgi:hypothetical protein